MSRIGPYSSLLIALLLLLIAIVPPIVPKLLLTLNVPPERADALAGNVGVGLAIISAGFIVVSLMWLLRIARIEAAWLPFRDAMVGVAAPLGEPVKVDYPGGMTFAARVGDDPVQVLLDPGEGGRISVVAAVSVRNVFLFLRRGSEVQNLVAGWTQVGRGQTWELYAPRPERIEWIPRDLDLVARLEALFDDGNMRLMGVLPQGGQVIFDLVAPEEVGEVVMRSFQAVAVLSMVNLREQPRQKVPAIW